MKGLALDLPSARRLLSGTAAVFQQKAESARGALLSRFAGLAQEEMFQDKNEANAHDQAVRHEDLERSGQGIKKVPGKKSDQ